MIPMELLQYLKEVQQEFREEIQEFSSNLKFKYDFNYKRYSVLYCKLYEIVIQSEYVRHFLEIDKGKQISFEEAPFIEISIKNCLDRVDAPITDFNKKELCDYIINNGKFASQELLKKAVSYRFAYSHYSGNGDAQGISSHAADEEEVRLIGDIICLIVKEYNSLRRDLKMSFDAKEIDRGIVNL